MKKILGFLIAVLMMSGVVISSGVVSQPAMAAAQANYNCPGGSSASEEMNNRSFLMFRPWYYNLCFDSNNSIVAPNSEDDGTDFTKFVWTIIMNVVYDLFAIIGVIAVGFVIYGGYVFLTAGGDPGKIAKAKKVLTSAIVGILVALSATMIVDTITSFIGNDPGTAEHPTDVNSTFNGAVKLVLSVAGMVATAFIVYGGITYSTSNGDPAKVKRGRSILTFSIVGLLVVLLAFSIVNFVIGAM